jgi:ADP-ribose pyrophosphatase
MRRSGSGTPETFSDLPAAVEVSAPRLIGQGYRGYEHYEVLLSNGCTSARIERDVLRSGAVVGILPLDLRRDEVVLIRQFRLGGHIAMDRGATIEIPAGRVGPDETPKQAASRECYEETGARPLQLRPLFAFMPAPALSDECMTFYVASIDAGQVKRAAGREDEHENIETMRLPIDTALRMLDGAGLHNGIVLVALQWLAMKREALRCLFEQEVV